MIYQLGDRKVTTKTDKFYIAPSADVIGSVTLGDNVSIWFNAVIRADHDDVIIGDNSNIQDNAVVHVDPGKGVVIGENVTVGHCAMIHSCEIGDNTLVGINSVILGDVKIGKNCIIGANALIPEGKEIPDNSVVMGSPGKVVKELTEEQTKLLKLSADFYVKNGQLFEEQLTEDTRFK